MRPATGTAGSLDRRIWALAGPAVLTLAAEPLYLLADTAIVARLGAAPLGGLAVASAILLFAANMLVFLTFGTAAATARLLGAGDPGEAAEQSVQGLWLGGGLGLVVGVGVALAAAPLVGIFGAEPSVVDEARTYLGIAVWGMPAMTLALAGTGALRGHMDTRTPLVVSIAANSVNVALDLVLIFGLGWGIAGSALATVVAKWGAAVAYVAIVARMALRRGARLAPDGTRIRRLAVVGRDLFVRTVALRASLTLAVTLAARKGTTSLAAFQIAFQWWAFCAYLLDALEAAAQSLVAAALGSSDEDLARRTARRILAWAFGAGAVVGVATAVGAGVVAGWFTDDDAVLALLTGGLVWVGLMQPVNGVAFALDGVLVGAGDQKFLAVAMVASAVVLAAGAPLVAASDALWPLWALLAVFMASRVVVLGARYRSGRWLRTGAVA